MPTLLFSNNARSKLAAPINAAATSCFLTAGTGSLFPSPGANEGFYLTFNDAGTGLLTEVVLVTLIAGDEILIMERAQQGTPAQRWYEGDFASQFYTAGDADTFTQGAALGTMAYQNADSVAITGGTIDNVNYNQLTLTGSTSETLTIKSSAVAGDWVFTLPPNPGSSGYVLETDGAGNTAWINASFANEILVGTTQVVGGTSGFILYNNAGILGNLGTTGTGTVVLANSPTLVTPALGAATATTLNGLTITTTTGTLSIASGGSLSTAGAFSVAFTAAAPTTLTLPASGTVTALGNASTGSGSIVLANSPAITSAALTTPDIGAATGTSLALTGELSGADGRFGTVGSVRGRVLLAGDTSGTLTLRPATSTQVYNFTFPPVPGTSGEYLQTDGFGNTSWAGALTDLIVGSTIISNGTSGYILYDAAGVLGILATNGTGNVVLTTNPALVTPNIGDATATTVNGLTIDATNATLALANGSTFTTSGSFSVTLTAIGATALTLPTSGVVTALGNDVTGTGNIVLANSPALITPDLGTPTAALLTNATGLPLTTGVTGLLPVGSGGTGVTSSTGTGSVVLSTSPILVTPNLGTPTAAILTNATGLPLTTGVTGLLPVTSGGTGVTSSTGTGSVVLSDSPTLVTPALGVPSALTLTNATGLSLTTGVTGLLPIANGGNGTASPGLVAGTNVTISGSWPTQTINASGTSTSIVVGTTSITSGTTGYILYNNAGVLGNLATTGSGSVVLATSPTLITPTLGVAAATSLALGTSGSVRGFLTLAGSTSGLVTVQPGTTAGSWTLTLPSTGGTNGFFLQTDGSGNASWAATALTVNSTAVSGGTTGYILYNNAGVLGNLATTGSGAVVLANSPTFLGNTTHSVPSSGNTISIGQYVGSAQLSLTGSTSGTVNIKTAAVAGTWSMTLPTTAGTSGYLLQTDGTGVTSWVVGGLIVGTSPVTNSTNGYILYNNAGTLGNLATTGTGSVVLQNTPALTLGTQSTTQGTLVLANTNASAYPTTLKSSNSATAAYALTLPVNAGTTGQYLQTDGSGVTSWGTVVTALTVGTTPTSGGAAGQIMFDTGSVLQESSGLVWDNTNKALTTTSIANPVVPTLQIVGGSNITGTAITGVSITGSAGQFFCTAASLFVGQFVTISGTFGGTGSITGYANPTTYLISATNGSTTFTLVVASTSAAIVTVAGTPTGLTYTVTAPLLNMTETWNNSNVLFTGLKLNITNTASVQTSSQFPSKLIDIQNNGNSWFSLTSCYFLTNQPAIYGLGGNPFLSLASSGTVLGYGTNYAIALGGTSFTVSNGNLGGSAVYKLNMTDSAAILASNMSFGFSSTTQATGTADLILTRKAAATLQFGAADAAAPVAQTVGVQSVVAGTSNTAGANFTINGSVGTGTGAGGSIIFQTAPASTTGSTQNALAAALTIAGTGVVTVGGFVATTLNVGSAVTTNAPIYFANTTSLQYNLMIQGTNSFAGNPIGLYINPNMGGNTTTTQITGLQSTPIFGLNASATNATAIAIGGNCYINNTVSPVNAYGIQGIVQIAAPALSAVAITKSATFYATAPSISASATMPITSMHSFYAENIVKGTLQTITNAYAFYGNQAAGSATNSYNLYMAGAAPNYLASQLTVADQNSQTGSTLSGVAITGTAGQFSCTAASPALVVGQLVTISGTFGGTGSINGYVNPTNYYISATNGSTTFTLINNGTGSALITTAGTPTGLTYSYNTTPAINATQTWNSSTTPFTGLKLNVTDTASNASSLLLDFQVGALPKFNIRKDGVPTVIVTDGPVIRVTDGAAYPTLLTVSNYTPWAAARQLVSVSAINAASTGGFSINNDTILTRKAAANLNLGATDAAAPVAQTLSVQGVVAGTSNTAGVNFTITGSQGTGTGVGGDIIFQVAPASTTGSTQNALATAMRVYNNKTVTIGAAFTVSTLPTAGTQGRRTWVTDALAPTFLGTLTGGGAVVTPVFDNGSAWVAG